MLFRKIIISIYLCLFCCASIYSQTHNSVSFENQIYPILEQAELRGLCGPLPGTKPYTHSVVAGKINEILNGENAGRLSAAERGILNQYLESFSRPKPGFDWQRGAFFTETAIGTNKSPLTLNIGGIAEIQGSTGINSPDDGNFGMDLWLSLYANGDMGPYVSYGFTFEGGLIRAPRRSPDDFLTGGDYYTYYAGYPLEGETDSDFANRIVQVYSEPLTHFPYTYKKRWDGSVYFFSHLAEFNPWPGDFAAGYNFMPAELTGSFLEDKLIMRMGRLYRDWGSTPLGSSLAFNQMTRPFLAIEAEFNPISWFSTAMLTGVLEYYNAYGVKDSAMSFQNAFSINMLQFRYKNYLFLDFIESVVWPKRFELGYISPIISNFFYQNNIGDFDNMSVTLNLKAQYPGLGSLWFSIFIDEMDLTNPDWFTLDRQMYAVQAGINLALPFLSFSSLKISYTRIKPYCYTHPRIYTPWHGDIRMETAYVNNGTSLGHYLPPNSDEILVRYATLPVKNVSAHLQYQLIRHGADYGSSAVDGSNLLSELDYHGIGSKTPELYSFFLQDGAYQWNHIIKAGAEWKLPGLPVTLYGEAGTVISYFTNISAPANSTGKAHPYSRINTPEYPEATGFVAQIGLKVFSR